MALDFGNKVENGGIPPNGVLPASEFNQLVEQVNKNEEDIQELSTPKSAYGSYLDTTTDNPPLTEEEWVASLHGEDGVDLGQVAIADDLMTNDGTKVLSAKQGYVLNNRIDSLTFPIVDDLTTGGTTSALSAEQGKVLGNRTQALYSTKSYDSSDLEDGRIWDLKNNDTISDNMGYGADFGCMYLSVKAGDSVTVAAAGGRAARAWGVTDIERYKIDVADSGESTISNPITLNIDEDGFVFINCAQSSYASFSVVHSYNKTLEDINALEEQVSELEERVDALEEGGYETVTCEWETDHSYNTIDYHTEGESGQKSTLSSTSFDCLFVDLTQDFKSIHFTCRGYGYAGSPYYACTWYLLDADDDIVSIETDYSNVADVTLTLEEVRGMGAVGLYLNNYKSWSSGGVDNPSCVITKIKGSDSGGGGEAECVISETTSWAQKRYFNTSGKSVGSNIADSVTQSNDYICAFVDLTKGFNKISFHCHTAWSGAAPYYFVGSDRKIIEIASTGEYDKTYTNDNIPSGAVGLYINHNAVVYSSEEPYCIVERSVSDTFDNTKSLKGKKVLMFGDSITWFKDRPLGKRYSDYFAEKTGATVYNVGVSGSHLNTSNSDPSSSNSGGYNVVEMVYAWLTGDFTNPDYAVVHDDNFAEQVALLKTIREVDIVTILAGTNDWGDSNIGEPSDADATSFYDNNDDPQNPRAGTTPRNFYSSIKYIVQGILSIYPQTKIYFFTPPVRWIKVNDEFTDDHWCDSHDSSNHVKLSELCEGIASAASYMHVPCCDVYNGMGWTKFNWLDIAPDGTHPLNGMEALGHKVAGFVTSHGNFTFDRMGQEKLVSGTNIKTVNNQSLLGSGNITIQGGSGSAVQSDWNQSDSTADDYIKNKPTIPAAQVQSNWNESDNTSKAYIQNKPTIPTVPTNVSAFTNDAGYLTQHQSIKTVNNESMVGSGNLNLLPTDVFNNFCPIIEDTRSSNVGTITGVAPFATLASGQIILLHLAYGTTNGTKLKLTLSDGTDTAAINVMYSNLQAYTVLSQIGGLNTTAGMYLHLIYNGTDWIAIGFGDGNTQYAVITQALISAGTNTTSKTISAKIFHDNAYIVEETYSSGSLKANKMYDFGTVSSLTIPSLDATNDLVSNALNFYALRFIAGADDLNITFPTGVVVDDTPTINTGDYVEIMINKYGNNFYASIKVWQAPS